MDMELYLQIWSYHLGSLLVTGFIDKESVSRLLLKCTFKNNLMIYNKSISELPDVIIETLAIISVNSPRTQNSLQNKYRIVICMCVYSHLYAHMYIYKSFIYMIFKWVDKLCSDCYTITFPDILKKKSHNHLFPKCFEGNLVIQQYKFLRQGNKWWNGVV
jgi:hypothetical protein